MTEIEEAEKKLNDLEAEGRALIAIVAALRLIPPERWLSVIRASSILTTGKDLT